jgi:hypothetical protein
MSKIFTIFISHSWSHDKHHINLKTLLNNRGYFNIEFEEATKDEPINSDDSKYIKQVLAKKIKNSNIVLGIAGIYASHSEWMKWELTKAEYLGIPIIGVIPRGQERISTVVSSRSEKNVNWNTESIVHAIRQYSI